MIVPTPSIACLAYASIAAAAPTPPTFTYLFTANFQVGKILSPIKQTFGDIQYIEPLLNGTVTGPGLNGTIIGGLSVPVSTPNGAYRSPNIEVYGMTSDGYPFTSKQFGVGPTTQENTWFDISISGKASLLEHVFILAHNEVNRVSGIASIIAYGVNMNERDVALLDGST